MRFFELYTVEFLPTNKRLLFVLHNALHAHTPTIVRDPFKELVITHKLSDKLCIIHPNFSKKNTSLQEAHMVQNHVSLVDRVPHILFLLSSS